MDGDEAGQSEEYSFNEDAAFFYKVAARVTYITESKASVTPAASKDFERNDYYTYILELDADRKVIGGEWYGASRKKHPDFLWNPERAWRSAVPNLDLEKVRELIRLSREEPAPTTATEDPAEEPAID